MMDAPDLAMNNKLWAYVPGRVDRQRHIVIRVRRGEQENPKRARESLNVAEHGLARRA